MNDKILGIVVSSSALVACGLSILGLASGGGGYFIFTLVVGVFLLGVGIAVYKGVL